MIAWPPGVDDEHAEPAATEHHRRREPRRAAAHDDHVEECFGHSDAGSQAACRNTRMASNPATTEPSRATNPPVRAPGAVGARAEGSHSRAASSRARVGNGPRRGPAE